MLLQRGAERLLRPYYLHERKRGGNCKATARKKIIYFFSSSLLTKRRWPEFMDVTGKKEKPHRVWDSRHGLLIGSYFTIHSIVKCCPLKCEVNPNKEIK
jgi:hypothetical protein